jgi:hypothetical protein
MCQKMVLFFAENVLVFDGKTPIHNPPEYPETMELVLHNLLAAHMFHILTCYQAMQHLQINPTKNQTIHTLLQGNSQPSSPATTSQRTM